jgi:hypothetical protein
MSGVGPGLRNGREVVLMSLLRMVLEEAAGLCGKQIPLPARGIKSGFQVRASINLGPIQGRGRTRKKR